MEVGGVGGGSTRERFAGLNHSAPRVTKGTKSTLSKPKKVTHESAPEYTPPMFLEDTMRCENSVHRRRPEAKN